MADFPDIDEGGIGVLPEKKTRLKKPKLYKVILHNDDFTTMEFVVFILEHVFKRTEAESVAIMLAVHNQGKGIAGTYSYEIATEKCQKAINLARSRQYPLLCTVEEE